MLTLALALVVSQPFNLNQTGLKRIVCDGGVTCWQDGGIATIIVSATGAGAPTNATYITQTPNATLTNEQALSALGTGLMSNTTGTGVVSIYGGSACGANQYATSASAAGALTCSQVATSQLSGTITDGQLASSYSGVGACAANTFATTLNDNASPTCSAVNDATAAALQTVTIRRTTAAGSGGTTLAQEGTGTVGVSQMVPGTGNWTGRSVHTGTAGTAGALLNSWGWTVGEIGAGAADVPGQQMQCKKYGQNGEQMPYVASGTANGVTIAVTAAGAGGLASGAIAVTFIAE